VGAVPLPYPTTVYYNLYATDGWVQLADGTMQYIYGYVGGREGDALNYLDFGLATGGPPPAPAVPPPANGGTVVNVARRCTATYRGTSCSRF